MKNATLTTAEILDLMNGKAQEYPPMPPMPEGCEELLFPKPRKANPAECEEIRHNMRVWWNHS